MLTMNRFLIFFFLLHLSCKQSTTQPLPQVQTPRNQYDSSQSDVIQDCNSRFDCRIGVDNQSFANSVNQEPSLQGLLALQSRVTGKLRKLGKELLGALDEHDKGYAECQKNGIKEAPLLPPAVKDALRKEGVDSLNDRLLNELSTPPPPSESTSVGKDETDSEEEEEEPWFNDQTNWGIINFLTAISMAFGAMMISTKVEVDFRNENLNTRYNDWLKTSPKGTLDDFRTHLKSRPEFSGKSALPENRKAMEGLDERIKVLNRKGAKLKAAKYGGLVLAGGTAILAFVMFGSGAGFFLASGECAANGVLLTRLSGIKDEAATYKQQLGMIEVQLASRGYKTSPYR